MHVVEKVFVSLLISAISKPTASGEPIVLLPLKIQWMAKNSTLQNLWPLANVSLLNIPGASATARIILGIIKARKHSPRTKPRGWSWGRVQGVRTPFPWDDMFASKICLPRQSVTPFLSGAPLLRKILDPSLKPALNQAYNSISFKKLSQTDAQFGRLPRLKLQKCSTELTSADSTTKIPR